MNKIYKLLFVITIVIWSGCAKTYLLHPFPEQPFNDIPAEALKYELIFNKDYSGSVRIKRKLLAPYWNQSTIYYNDRLIGKVGNKPLRIYLSKGTYVLNYKSKSDTIGLSQAGVLECGPYNIHPTTINRIVGTKFYIKKISQHQ